MLSVLTCCRCIQQRTTAVHGNSHAAVTGRQLHPGGGVVLGVCQQRAGGAAAEGGAGVAVGRASAAAGLGWQGWRQSCRACRGLQGCKASHLHRAPWCPRHASLATVAKWLRPWVELPSGSVPGWLAGWGASQRRCSSAPGYSEPWLLALHPAACTRGSASSCAPLIVFQGCTPRL